MDFLEGLALSDGYNVIMVVVDRFTKYTHVVPRKHPYTVSDRDRIFTSAFCKLLFQKLGTKLNHTTTYHPQSDGQTERVNQCLEMFLRCMV
jgi:hypothetical protein